MNWFTVIRGVVRVVLFFKKLMDDDEKEKRIERIATLCFFTGYVVGLIVLFFLGDLSIIWNFWSGWWLTLILLVSLFISIVSVFFIILIIDGIIELKEISAFFVPSIANTLVFVAMHTLVRWLLV